VSDDKTTVVEEGTAVEGTLTSRCRVLVLGTVKGEVTGPAVEVAPGGVIRGTVKAASLRSRGELGGRFEADEVELGGKVLDETVVRAKSLQVDASAEGGALFGSCELEVGDAPDKARAVQEASAPRGAAPPNPTPA
jgi:cytoskeletal protein CcmA (bactofilin family)